MRRRKSALNGNLGGMKAAEESAFSIGQEVCFLGGRIIFLTERCANVIENKGRVWKALA